MRFIENRTQLLVRARIPVVDAAHAVRLAKLVESHHNGITDVVNALDGRTVIGHTELANITTIDGARTEEYPLDFKVLMERLHESMTALATYCATHDENTLGLFFDPANGCGGSMRELMDGVLEVSQPSFG